ncbi:MAG TPA: VOC family protein [Chloroflexota bacterium]|nr:VOC family protein [Chloroflexota bacterium]
MAMYRQGNVTVMISDMSRAVDFYTQKLGLSLKMRVGDDWAEVEAPGLTIGLHRAAERGPRPGQLGSMSIGLQVDQLDRAMEALNQKGVQFAPQVSDDGFVRIAHFGDPDNTPLYICEIRHPATSS